MLQANYHILLTLSLRQTEFAKITKIFKLSEKRAKAGCKINFLKRCIKNNITPNTIKNMHLPACFNHPKRQISRNFLHKFCIKELIRHLHYLLHLHINELNNTLTRLTITPEISAAINQCYHNSVRTSKERLKSKFNWLLHKNNPNPIISPNNNVPTDNNDMQPTASPLVTDLTNSLMPNELELLSLGPKFITTQKLDDKAKLNIEAQFCRAAYHLKWLSAFNQDTQNTPNSTDNPSTIENAATFPTYQLDRPLHPPPDNHDLDRKLTRLWHNILSIIKREQSNFTPNLTRTQRTTLKNLKDRNLVFLPSDKGKEFCVIAQDTYDDLALEHLSNDTLYTPTTDISPTEIENQINTAWTLICKKRNLPNSYKRNLTTRNSRLPIFYHLIKTHKNSPTTQIRPIVSSTEGPLYKVSWLLSQLLKPLLATYPGHVSNSDEVIHRLRSLQPQELQRNRYAFSLDVISLYTSVPAHPAVDLITDCISSNDLHCLGLTATDIHQLLNIIVDNTYFTYNGQTYKQITGLPMGSSLSGLLAITYMNRLEQHALHTCHSSIFFTRYVDDILILTSSREEADKIFISFKNTDHKIQFTIEHPKSSGSLSLLDFTLYITDEGLIHTNFYRKPACRDIFVNYKSALPTKAKMGYALNEVNRIRSKCTTETDKTTSVRHFQQTLERNGYPTNNRHYTRTSRKHPQQTLSNTCFLKIPHFNDRITSAIRRAIRKEHLDIQLTHSGPTLRQHLSKPRTPSNTNPCTLANCPISNTGLCNRTYAIYQIQCAVCNEFYIGSTVRALHIRIKEHVTTKASSFQKHIAHGHNPNKDIRVNILASERDQGNLRIKESIFIRKLSPKLNNRAELNFNFLV